jgi:hypothetical protein
MNAHKRQRNERPEDDEVIGESGRMMDMGASMVKTVAKSVVQPVVEPVAQQVSNQVVSPVTQQVVQPEAKKVVEPVETRKVEAPTTLVSAELYFYNEATSTFQSIEEPTPFITSYYSYEEGTHTYTPYTGPLYFSNEEYKNPEAADYREEEKTGPIAYESSADFYQSILTNPAEQEEEEPTLYYYDYYTESLQSIPEATPYINEYY